MGNAVAVSVEEYLSTVYSPDRDYIDGELLERNLGERPHSKIQLKLGAFFEAKEKSHRLYAYPEQRLQIGPSRYRVPDLLVLRGTDSKDPVLQEAPFLIVEILSRNDTLGGLHERIQDYLGMGVPYVWVIDPIHRTAWRATREGYLESREELRLDAVDVSLDLRELFASLD